MKPAASMKEVLEFCTKVREAGGGNPLEALMPGIPEDAKSCLIARNLNFECIVGCLYAENGETVSDVNAIRTANEERARKHSGAWFMTLEDKETRDRIAASLELQSVNLFCRKRFPSDPKTHFYSVLLPLEIGNVAANFDSVGAMLENERESELDEEGRAYAELVETT